MKIINIEKKDLEDFSIDVFRMQIGNRFVFRGYCKNEELLPTLIRNYLKLNLNKFGIRNYEEFLLKNYGKYSIQYLPSYFTPLDFVASAQHYGLPTRLIDWTFDPFCALYFAVSFNKAPQDDYYKLIAIDLQKHMYFNDVPTFKTDARCFHSTNNELLDYYFKFVDALPLGNGCLSQMYNEDTKSEFCKSIRAAMDEEYKEQKHKLFFCSIYDSNPRIIAQNGLFQIPRRFCDEQSNFVIERDIYDAAEIQYRIDKDLRDDVLRFLKNLNITTPRLFPDLQSICQHLTYSSPI